MCNCCRVVIANIMYEPLVVYVFTFVFIFHKVKIYFNYSYFVIIFLVLNSDLLVDRSDDVPLDCFQYLLCCQYGSCPWQLIVCKVSEQSHWWLQNGLKMMWYCKSWNFVPSRLTSFLFSVVAFTGILQYI